MVNVYRFRKTERITLRKEIEHLFEQGHSSSVQSAPLRAVFQFQPARLQDGNAGAACPEPIKILVSVAKKRLRHAVDRNRAKRQVREAYRQQHHSLSDALITRGRQMRIAFVWLSSQPEHSASVNKAMVCILQTIEQRLKHRGQQSTIANDAPQNSK